MQFWIWSNIWLQRPFLVRVQALFISNVQWGFSSFLGWRGVIFDLCLKKGFKTNLIWTIFKHSKMWDKSLSPPDVLLALVQSMIACKLLSFKSRKFSQVPEFDVWLLLFYIPPFCLIVVLNVIDRGSPLFSPFIQANNPAIFSNTPSLG